MSANDILIFIYYFIPVWSFIIWYLPIKGKKAYILTEIFLLAFTVQAAYNPWRIVKITFWIHYYSLFIMIYILALGILTKFSNYSKVLASSLWMVFIAGDIWEIPNFAYDIIFLNVANWTVWISSHIHRIYVLASALLFNMHAKIQATRGTLTLLALTIGTNFIILHPYFRNGWSIQARLLTLSAFTFIIYYGVRDGSPLVDS